MQYFAFPSLCQDLFSLFVRIPSQDLLASHGLVLLETIERARVALIASLSLGGYSLNSRRNLLPLASYARLLLSLAALSAVVFPHSLRGQAKPAPPVPAAKTPPVGPAAPQSKHYPILLLAFGNEPNWNVRIGLKGPERFDRAGYPPITLEPAEVTYETAADTWTYHAKDSVTGAAVAVHLSRQACIDAKNDTLTTAPPLGGKYSFRASVEHTQIGTLKGCARVATELFPKINNQPDPEAEEEAKKHPPVPVSTVTKFQSPIAFAYVNTAGKIVFKRGAVTHVIATEGSQLAVSHDGKRLLFTHEEKADNRSIFLYDFATEKSTELLRGSVQEAFWSPDDTRFAFLKFVDGKWQLWVAPISAPESAVAVYSAGVSSLQGWADAHTILVDDAAQLSWIADDGTILLSLSHKEVYGDVFGNSSLNTIRIHPATPDLLLISAEIPNPPAGMPKDPHTGGSIGFGLYEIRSKRRTMMTPPNMLAEGAEWSRDGLQLFFTGQEPGKPSAVYRVFWDGIGLQKFASGTQLVIGQ